jgi:hemerythrin
MESFHWDQYFVTGLTEIDDQHHRLVDLINQFGTLLADNVVHSEDVERLFNELADYADYHFKEEEELMIATKLDARHVNRHIDVHKRFLDDVSLIYSDLASNKADRAESFLKFLINWLAYHILGQDQDMARQVKAMQSGMTADQAFSNLEQERVRSTEPLIEALHGLFEYVSKQNKELKQLNESLEEKVALRTKELTATNLQLKQLSLTDVLTELPNRRHALLRLAQFWEQAVTANSPLTCLMIDADHFKEVNDAYGHDVGDLVLIEMAKTLQHSTRNDDVVCRLGGDEFFIICPNTDETGGMHIAELTRSIVSTLRVPTGGTPWLGSISVGVASRLPSMASYEELIKKADKGVYAAKEAGKNCVRAAD